MLIFPFSGKTQTKDNVEISLFSVYNMQGNYTTRYGDAIHTDHLKLYGTNRGFKIDYKRLLYGHTYLKAGMGYMDFAVDNLEDDPSNIFPTTHARLIHYPRPIFIQYATTKYDYHTLLYHLGIERQFAIKTGLYFFADLDYFYATSLSQKYYIPGIPTWYQTANEKGFGNFVNLNVGIRVKMQNFSLIPALVIPVYKSWKQDIVFYENPNSTINTWFNGIGISLSVSYP
jgi:hypothetical protein